MRRARKTSLIVLWLVLATLVHARLWVTYTDFFPEYPEWVGLLVTDLVDRRLGGGGVEETTLYYVLGLSLLNVSLLTGAVLFVLHAIKAARPGAR
jgi:hypothetical protein